MLFAAEETLPQITIPWVEEEPVIDARLVEPAWSDAVELILWDYWSDQTPRKDPLTRVQLLASDEGLWVAFNIKDMDVVVASREHDGPTFRDDSVEIFMGGCDDFSEELYCFEINLRTDVADFIYREDQLSNRFDFDWNAEGLQIASKPVEDRKDEGRWVMEILIPWHVIGLLGPECLRANFARWDRAALNDRFTIWSNPYNAKPNPHNARRCGRLTFEALN